jgi:nicotinate phosphoribosyltransferase
VEIDGIPKMKLSENIEKNTLPAKKQLYRFYDNNGLFYRDAIALANENPDKIETVYHPVYPEKHTSVKGLVYEKLLHDIVKSGVVVSKMQEPLEIHESLKERVKMLPDEHKRFISPHIYKTGITKKLMQTRNTLSKQITKPL